MTSFLPHPDRSAEVSAARSIPFEPARQSCKPIRTFARLAWRDRLRPSPSGLGSSAHLLAAEQWLGRAQDATDDGGVSYGYSIKGGWRASYPETSGYIATTFFRLGRLRDPAYTERAWRIVRWLLSIQNPDGSFANPRYGREGIVFDTGQVLFGLVRAYEDTPDPAVLRSARRAAAWLAAMADADGRWTRHEHLATPHVYNARTAWAMLRMNEIEPNREREAVARSNLDWAVESQRPSGFFDHCGFGHGQNPFTHTLAYTARGLLESGLLLNDDRYLEAARHTADAALQRQRDDGFLASAFTPEGKPMAASCCLTGNCQFAIVWLRLAAAGDGVAAYGVGARRSLSWVMATQDLTTDDPDVHGAIKGSQPVWGRYAPLSFPNWATKFFIDAMWLAGETTT